MESTDPTKAKQPEASCYCQPLSECPLLPFIEGKVPRWDNKTPEAIAVHQWALLRRPQIWRYLRLNVLEDHPPVRTVNKLLRKLSYTVQEKGWKGGRTDRQRQYIISNLQDVDRGTILQTLEERFINRLEKEWAGDRHVPQDRGQVVYLFFPNDTPPPAA